MKKRSNRLSKGRKISKRSNKTKRPKRASSKKTKANRRKAIRRKTKRITEESRCETCGDRCGTCVGRSELMGDIQREEVGRLLASMKLERSSSPHLEPRSRSELMDTIS